MQNSKKLENLVHRVGLFQLGNFIYLITADIILELMNQKWHSG